MSTFEIILSAVSTILTFGLFQRNRKIKTLKKKNADGSKTLKREVEEEIKIEK